MDPGTKNFSTLRGDSAPPARSTSAFRIGSPKSRPSEVEDPIAMSVPPASTNRLSSGTVHALLTVPRWSRSSRGTRSAGGCAPAAASRAGNAPSTKISTSKRFARFPASRPFYTTSNGNSNCSSSHRVQPDGIDPPYLIPQSDPHRPQPGGVAGRRRRGAADVQAFLCGQALQDWQDRRLGRHEERAVPEPVDFFVRFNSRLRAINASLVWGPMTSPSTCRRRPDPSLWRRYDAGQRL